MLFLGGRREAEVEVVGVGICPLLLVGDSSSCFIPIMSFGVVTEAEAAFISSWGEYGAMGIECSSWVAISDFALLLDRKIVYCGKVQLLRRFRLAAMCSMEPLRVGLITMCMFVARKLLL